MSGASGMSGASNTIFAFLESHGIEYLRFDHPPVYTCDEALETSPDIPGADTKNLFLRDGKGRHHYVVAVPPEKRVDLKAFGALLGVSGLSFASARRLAKHLGVEPGAVTLLGVINDLGGAVEVIIDEEIWAQPAIQSHPLVNTSTLVISRQDMARFFQLTEHPPRVLLVPGEG